MTLKLSKNISRFALASLALSAFAFAGCDVNSLLNMGQPKPQAGPATKATGKAAHASAAGTTLLPETPITGIQYRPIVSVGKDLVSGTGKADTEKARGLNGKFASPIIVNPEIFKGLSAVQSLALREAIAEACRNADADFLLVPRYELTVETLGGQETKVACTVSGYPAKIVGFEEIPPAPTRQELVAEYLEIMQKYGISKDVPSLLALMGATPPNGAVAEPESADVPEGE